MKTFMKRYEYSTEHLRFMQDTYKVGTKILSPKGREGEVFCYTHNGFLIRVDKVMVEVPFDQIGYYKIV